MGRRGNEKSRGGDPGLKLAHFQKNSDHQGLQIALFQTLSMLPLYVRYVTAGSGLRRCTKL
ncbi:MAG: hypothetical protein CL958_10290 [Euryarchaeota archaeon]|nr:hypothetical protein [Marinobacter sp.]